MSLWRERYRWEQAGRRAAVAGILLDCARALRGCDDDVATQILNAVETLIRRARPQSGSRRQEDVRLQDTGGVHAVGGID